MEFCNKKSDIKCLFIFDVAMPTVYAVRFAQKDHLIEFVVPPVGESLPESLGYGSVVQ